ncbi:heat shock protein 70 family protein, partial [Kipferlia bialata]
VLQHQYADMVTLDSVQWCLTVPAMWTDKAKSQMRQAAFRAGMIQDEDSKRLLLVLEPEAAAVFTRKKVTEYHFEEDTVFMVADCGGGTVDLTTHKLVNEGGRETLVEVTKGQGQSIGATFVDKDFVKYCRKRLGNAVWDTASQKCPAAVSTLMGHWEAAKRSIGEEDADAIYLSIPPKILRMIPADVIERLSEEQDDIDDEIVIDTEEGKAILEPTVDKICDLIQSQIDAGVQAGGKALDPSAAIDVIVLVGGFTGSPYLVDRVKERFGGVCSRILNPPEPGAAVVTGAVHYGFNPNEISKRRSRYTYGIETEEKFDPENELHVQYEDRKELHKGRYILRKWFRPFVEVNELVELDHKQDLSPLYPTSVDQTEAVLKLYQVDREGVHFTDTVGVKPLGEGIRLPIPKSVGACTRAIRPSVHFGASEI